MPGCKKAKLRRFALQIVQQLPENKAEAVMVLGFIQEIIAWENGAAVEAVDRILRIGVG